MVSAFKCTNELHRNAKLILRSGYGLHANRVLRDAGTDVNHGFLEKLQFGDRAAVRLSLEALAKR